MRCPSKPLLILPHGVNFLTCFSKELFSSVNPLSIIYYHYYYDDVEGGYFTDNNFIYFGYGVKDEWDLDYFWELDSENSTLKYTDDSAFPPTFDKTPQRRV